MLCSVAAIIFNYYRWYDTKAFYERDVDIQDIGPWKVESCVWKKMERRGSYS